MRLISALCASVILTVALHVCGEKVLHSRKHVLAPVVEKTTEESNLVQVTAHGDIVQDKSLLRTEQNEGQTHSGALLPDAGPLKSTSALDVKDKLTAPQTQGHEEHIAQNITSFWAGIVQQSDAKKDYSHDWLYGYSKTLCGGVQWDSNEYSMASRAFLPMLFAAIVIAIIIIGRSRGGSLESLAIPEDSEQEAPHRRLDLDYARILCVTCVIWEHTGGWIWSQHNMFFSQQWVLPFLYLTSGSSFMLSAKGLTTYLTKLSAVLVVGVSANLMADQLTGRNWSGDFGNTIFQMAYVAMLIVVSVMAAPLRSALRLRTSRQQSETQDAEGASSKWLWASTAVFGLLTCIGFFFFISARPLPGVSSSHETLNAVPVLDMLSNIHLAVIQVAGILLLCHIACLFMATDLLAWLLLLYIYLPRLVIPYAGVGFPHNIELMIFAMVAQKWKIRGQRQIAELFQGYWPLFVFFLLLLSCADMQGRCDLLPASSFWERFRFYGIELALCLCLCTESFKVGDPRNFKATEWLNSWALFAYCFHVALARMFVQPYGGLMTYTSSIFFYAGAKYKRQRLDALK